MLLTLLLLLSPPAHASPFVQSVAKQELVHYGKLAYDRRCSGCHGEKGNGNGPAALWLNPKPRDFTSGIYKFRSSALGTMPSDEDLMRTLSHGVAGTSMPAFYEMPERERFAVVEYLKTFSKNWEDPAMKGVPVMGAPFPAEDFSQHDKFIERAKRGRAVFVEACVLCHGIKGIGDGSGAEGITDDWGQPIVPANLRKLTIKRGKSVQDIYTTLLVGVNGTPMPSFKDVYSDDSLWDVAAYVLYLRGEEAGQYGPNPLIAPIRAEEAP